MSVRIVEQKKKAEGLLHCSHCVWMEVSHEHDPSNPFFFTTSSHWQYQIPSPQVLSPNTRYFSFCHSLVTFFHCSPQTPLYSSTEKGSTFRLPSGVNGNVGKIAEGLGSEWACILKSHPGLLYCTGGSRMQARTSIPTSLYIRGGVFLPSLARYYCLYCREGRVWWSILSLQ